MKSTFYHITLLVSLLLNLQLTHANCSISNGFSTGEGSQPATILFNPNGKFAYVLLSGTNTIVVYNYDTQLGKLTKVSNSEVNSGGIKPTFGAVLDPQGKFMYVANQATSTIAVFSINQNNGKLTQIQLIQTPFYYPHVITISPNRLYAYITAFQANKLLLYKIDQQDGTLNPLITAQHPKGYIMTKNQPFLLNFSPSKKYAYLSSYGENSIIRYSYTANDGDLTLDSDWELTTPLLAKPYALLFDPSGNYAYAPVEMRNKILQFVNDNDQLKINSPAEVGTGINPNTLILFYMNNKFAYIGNYNDSSIDLYKVQDNGTLVANGQRISTIMEPTVLRQPPDATHIFVVSRRENCIADYNVNSQTGDLAPRYINTDRAVNDS